MFIAAFDLRTFTSVMKLRANQIDWRYVVRAHFMCAFLFRTDCNFKTSFRTQLNASIVCSRPKIFGRRPIKDIRRAGNFNRTVPFIHPTMASSSTTALIENKEGEETIHAIVDKEDENLVKSFAWRYALQGNDKVKYVIKDSTSTNSYVRMSHLILQKKPTYNRIVVFANADRLDHRKDNLQECTGKEAHAIRTKQASGSSQFLGVVEFPKNKPARRWRSAYSHTVLGFYPSEEMAAYKYNVHKKAVNPGLNVDVNDVAEPEGFTEVDAKVQAETTTKSEYPIQKTAGGFRIADLKRNKQVIAKGTYSTYEKAVEVCKAAIEGFVITSRSKVTIRRNDEGVAILKATKNAKLGDYVDVMVDDDIYVKLMVNDDGRATGLSVNKSRGGVAYLNSDKEQLSHHVMKTVVSEEEFEKARAGDLIVHHKSGDNEDNRRDILCFAPRTTNSQATRPEVNKKRKNPDSEYVGYKEENGKYRAQIKIKGKGHNLGLYETKKEAAAAYNKAVIKFHGEENAPRLNKLAE